MTSDKLDLDDVRTAIRNSGFKPALRCFLWTIAATADLDIEGFVSFTTFEDLLADTGYSSSTVDGYLRLLTRLGWITEHSTHIQIHPPIEALAGPIQYKPAGRISRTRRRAVYERDGYQCLECGTDKDLTLDHITPRVYGGTNDLDNLRTLCRSCNASKGVR